MTTAERADCPSDPSVSVIIPAHNAAETISEQLAALVEQRRSQLDVVVVLNRCSDQTEQVAREFGSSLPGLRLIVADERAGASYARNVGARSATGDVLLFCDADDIVAEGWIDELVSCLEHADVVGGRLEPLAAADDVLLDIFPVYRSVQRDSLASYHGISYAMTASMACTRRAFALAGGFDERFGHGCDDVVFALRAQRAGLRMGFASNALCSYRIRSDIEAMVRQRKSYARANVLYERTIAPAYSRPVLTEGVVFVALKIRALTCRPGSRRTRLVVHSRVQWTRLKESAVQSVRALATRKEVPSRRPGLTASLAQLYPSLRCTWPFRTGWDRWLGGAALVDVTAPLSLPIVGGLGFAVPLESVANETDKSELWTSNLLEASEWISAGDRVIDLAAGVGDFVTAAALLVGSAGDVTAVEGSALLAESCRQNLRRHSPPDVRVWIDSDPDAAVERSSRQGTVMVGRDGNRLTRLDPTAD